MIFKPLGLIWDLMVIFKENGRFDGDLMVNDSPVNQLKYGIYNFQMEG